MSLGIVAGQVIAGRYRVERLLARGGHGAVFVAEQLATEAKVALKVVGDVLDSTRERERFELEAKIAARADSEFIVRCLDAGVDEELGVPFLVMELLDGESLAEAVAKRGPLRPVETGTCLLHVAQGLDKAHGHRTRLGKRAPIVHCDLKPENLFWATRADGQRVTKILDFGIAKVVSESVVRTRAIRGSPLYLAYEQLTGEPITPRTDIWAFGLVAFFLLTGRPYWRTASRPEHGIAALFSEILHMPIVSPTLRAAELGVAPSWPAGFDTWFLQCVNRDPRSRFATAGSAARAFDALLAEEWDVSASRPLSVSRAPAANDAGVPRRVAPLPSSRPSSAPSPPTSAPILTKGTNFTGLLKVLEAHHGRHTVDRTFELLDAELASALRYGQVVTIGWYPIAWYAALHTAAARALDAGPELARKIGYQAALHDFTSLHRMIISLLTVDTVIGQAPRLMSLYHKGGHVERLEHTHERIVLSFTGWVGFTREIWEDITGSMECILDLCGATEPRCTAQGPLDAASCVQFELTWTGKTKPATLPRSEASSRTPPKRSA